MKAPYPLAAALCLLTMLAALPLREVMDLANIVMLFLLMVFLTAVRLGRGPSVMAAFFSVALFDFFFVPPHLSLAVADAQYLVTFAVMLAVGLITSHLTARLAERTEVAQARERDTRLLYELSRNLGGALTMAQAGETAADFVRSLGMEASVWVAGEEGDAIGQLGGHPLSDLEMTFARSALERGQAVEADSLAGTGMALMFLPLHGPTRIRGVLAVAPRSTETAILHASRPLLEAVASLIAINLERIHYADAARNSELAMSAERLRGSILSSLSHDLRTPLTSLVGLADSLTQAGLSENTMETATIIRDQAQAMHHLLSNLLEMAHLQAGSVALNREWQPFEEIVGSSTRLLAPILTRRRLEIDLPRDLPLVYFDAVLMERVLCNLLENAAKYSGEGAPIRLTARVEAPNLEVAVSNEGHGFPPERLVQVFEPFVRGKQEAAVPGTGLGLAICKAIIEAHGGRIAAENLADGACVRFALPLGTPPAVEEEP